MDVRYIPTRTPLLHRPGASATLVALQLAVIYIGTTLVTPLWQLYRERFAFSQLTLTLIFSAYLIGNVAALLFFSRLSDQIGRRAVSLIATGIAIVSTLLYLSATSIAWLVAGRSVSGLAIALGAGAATAWVADLARDQRSASVLAVTGNFSGLAAGALLSGICATWLSKPLHLSFVVYLALLACMTSVVAHLPETVKSRAGRTHALSLRPTLGIPAQLLARFIGPAAAAFATFAVIGYYAALIPGLLAEALHQESPIASSAVVALLCLIGVASAVLTRSLSSRTALLVGGALMLPAILLLPCAEAARSLLLLLAGTVLAGGATVLAYRGSLQVVNEMAPAGARGALIGSYILACYLGNSVPIVGIGVLSRQLSPLETDVIFACVIALLAILALVTGLTGTGKRRA
jgi:MFS family permease